MTTRTPLIAFLVGLLPTAYLLGVREARAEGAVKEVTAQSFVVVDAEGKPRFRIGAGKDGVGFVVTDAAGAVRASLAASDNATSLTLVDPVSGNTRVLLGVERAGNASVALHDRAGEPRTTLTVGAAGKKSP